MKLESRKRLLFVLHRGFLGFRLFGRWVTVCNRRKHPAPYSVRHGEMPKWSLGNWQIVMRRAMG